MIVTTDQTCSELAAIVGGAQVSADESACAALSAGGKAPRVIVFPSSGEEVAAALRYSSERGLAVIPCRNATKLMIGNSPRRYDIALSLKNLNRVWHFEPADLTISVEPGMKFGDFQNFVGKHNLWLPLDPAGGERASVGGILAANSSGSLQTFYGTARDMTLGMKIATTEGKIIKAGGRVVKNVAGYDLTKLMIGSFGTLGVIVEASFKLFPVPLERSTLILTAADLDKAGLIQCAVQAAPFRPLRFALLDRGMSKQVCPDADSFESEYGFWIELGGTRRVLTRCRDELLKIAGSFGETLNAVSPALDGKSFWQRLQSAFSTADASADTWILKASFPIMKVWRYLYMAKSRVGPHGVITGIYADPLAGIIRLQLRSANPEGRVVDAVSRLSGMAPVQGGSLVIEVAPAVAAGKFDPWGATGDDFEIMRKLKEALDPKGVLSPGRFVGGL